MVEPARGRARPRHARRREAEALIAAWLELPRRGLKPRVSLEISGGNAIMGAQLRRIDSPDSLDEEPIAELRTEAPKLHVAPIALPTPPRAPFPPQAASTAAPGIATARIHALEGNTVHLAIGGQIVVAAVDPSVHPAVLRGASERGERVLAERDEHGVWIVIGALRTQPTPGIDAADAYTIEADKITIRGKSEVSIVTEAAGLVVRALGEVETYADKIISRAEGVHKIVGRILRLN
jgi:hypothetical protein